MENIVLHTKNCAKDHKGHIEDLLLLLLFFNAQADTSSYLRTQRAIFLLQNRLNIEKSGNFSYSFYKTNTGPRCYKLVDDIHTLFENDFLVIQNKTEIIISDSGRKLAHELEEFLFNGKECPDFIEVYLDEASRLSTLSDRAMKLIVLEVKKNIFGHIRHKIIRSLGEKTLLQSGIKSRTKNSLNLTDEEIVTLLSMFSKNISNQIDKSIIDLSNGLVKLPRYSALSKVRITEHCRNSIIKEVFEHGLDEQAIGDIMGRFTVNPEKYKNNLKYNLDGLSSILIGKSVLTYISCDNNHQENNSKFSNIHNSIRKEFGNGTIILIAFGLLN